MLLLLCILFYFVVCFYWQIRVDLFLSCCFVALFSFIVYFCVLILFPQKQQKFIQFPPFSQQTQTHNFYIYTIFFWIFFFFYFYLGRRLFSWLGTLFFLLVSFACAFFLFFQKFLLSIASNSIYNFFNIFFWIALAYLLIFFQKTLYFINNFIYFQIYLHLF